MKKLLMALAAGTFAATAWAQAAPAPAAASTATQTPTQDMAKATDKNAEAAKSGAPKTMSVKDKIKKEKKTRKPLRGVPAADPRSTPNSEKQPK